MPRYLTQNPNVLRPVPYVQPQAQSLIEGISQVRKINLAPGTVKGYHIKQEKWKKWYDGKGFTLNYTVTPQLALLFLYEVVILESTGTQSSIADHATVEGMLATPGDAGEILAILEKDDEDGVASPLDKGDLDSVNTEIANSWAMHLSLGTNQDVQLSPVHEALVRSTVTPSTFNGYAAALVQLWATQCDNGVNQYSTPRSIYVGIILRALQKLRWEKEKKTYKDRGEQLHYDGYKDNSQVSATFAYLVQRNSEEGLRDACAQALGIFGLLRSDNQRLLTLADLSSRIWDNEGATRCLAISWLMRAGKTNRNGIANYATYIRNKDLRICPVAHLMMYLFARFYCGIKGPEFPNVTSKEKWYDQLLLVLANDRTKGPSYDAQRKAMVTVIRQAGVQSYKSTHINRKYGARLAEDGGAPLEDIARAGGWAKDTLGIHYLSHAPKATCRAQAGFKAGGGDFFLPRAVPVPSSLQRKVFPEVEQYIYLREQNSHLRDIAGHHFLETLVQLREVWLQDAPHLQLLYPDLYIWKNSLFQDPEYLRHREHALTQSAANTGSFSTAVQQVMPEVVSSLKAAQVLNVQQHKTVVHHFGQLEGGSINLQQQLADVITMVSLIQNALARPIVIPPLIMEEQSEQALTVEQSTSNSDNSVGPALLSVFTMDRSLRTVSEIWQEYAHGINGRPSVKAVFETDQLLELKASANETDKRWYRKQREIFRTIEVIARECNLPPATVAVNLDSIRMKQNNPSIGAFREHLKKNRSNPLGLV